MDDLDSLRLELEAERHVHRQDNKYLLEQIEGLEKELKESNDRSLILFWKLNKIRERADDLLEDPSEIIEEIIAITDSLVGTDEVERIKKEEEES